MAFAMIAAFASILVGVEVFRPHKGKNLDGLRLASLVFAVCFVVAPLYASLFGLTSLRVTAWEWLLYRDYSDSEQALATAMAMLCYLATAAAYTVARAAARAGSGRVAPAADLRIVGVICLLIGTVALVGYTVSIGGMRNLLFAGALFRTDTPPVVTRWAFLKNVAPLLLGASYCLYPLVVTQSGRRSRWDRILLWMAFAGALLILFHRSGRLSFVVFVVTFPLSGMIVRGRVRWLPILFGGSAILAAVVFGKAAFRAGVSTASVASQLQEARDDTRRVADGVIAEFSFPLATLSNTIQVVPSEISYRGGRDLLLAVQALLPQRFFGEKSPESVSDVNTTVLRPAMKTAVPVDLTSYGYFSGGVIGVAFVGLVFGIALAMVDRILPRDAPLMAPLRAAVLLFMAFRVMYGDPTQVLNAAFTLVVVFAGLLGLRLLRDLTRATTIQTPASFGTSVRLEPTTDA